MKNLAMDDSETLNRRARLRELIRECFGGKDEELLSFIERRTGKRPNQGELSAIKKDNAKSFGDKKARNLTVQIGLNRRWFDFPVGVNTKKEAWMNDFSPVAGEEQSNAPSFSQALKKKSATMRESNIQRIIDLLHQTNDDGVKSVLRVAEGIVIDFPISKQAKSSK
jgi:hypothetical protein